MDWTDTVAVECGVRHWVVWYHTHRITCLEHRLYKLNGSLFKILLSAHPSLSHSLSQIALSLAIILTLRLHVVVLVFVLSFWPCVQCSYSPIFYYDLLSRYIMLLCCSSSGSKIHRHTLNLSLGWAWGKKHANWRVWTTLLAHAVQMEFCYATHVMVN